MISLPGRGIDLALNLNYNSRVWSKSGTEMTFDIDRGFPAPGWSLGFGKIMDMGANGGSMIIDADGTRHGYSGTIFPSPGGYSSFNGHVTDGKYIDYRSNRDGAGVYYAFAYLPNGTTVSYGARGSGAVYPTHIQDANGNFITITYRNNAGPHLETITDTTGRVITFQYDSFNRLISATAPRMQDQDPIFGGGKTRTLFRLHYAPLVPSYSFAAGYTAIVRPETYYKIDAIYYPATKTGYWFGDADSYSSYGMITKVLEQRGMNWTAGTEPQGTVTPSLMTTKKAEYNYPLTTTNVSGRTNGTALTDAPTYTQLKEGWDGRDVNEDAVTTYAINNNDIRWDGTSNSPSRTITITQPTGVINKQYSYRTPGAWTDGLLFNDETIVMNGTTPTIVGSSLVSWQQGHYQVPRPARAEVTDENGKKVSTVYTYAIGPFFNQITRSCDYDNSNSLLRCSTAEYENSAAYIGHFDAGGVFQSGRHIFNLVKSTAVENTDGTRASLTQYEYDNYLSQPFVNAPGVIHHLSSHNPYTTDTQNGLCVLWSPSISDPACSFEGEEVLLPNGFPAHCLCLEYEQVSVYDQATEKRGNVTKITSYSDAQNLSGAIVETKGYDITGNLVTSSSSCCEQTSVQYDISTQFAYPVSQTRGAADPTSPHRITTTTVFDPDTGLLKQQTDANGRTSTTMYNPDTLRPAKAISATGAYTTFAYDDTAMTIVEETHEADGIAVGKLADKMKRYLNGLGLVRREDTLVTNDVIISSVEMKYDKFAREWKQSRPYAPGETPQWSENFYDLQGRLYKTQKSDLSVSQASFNKRPLPNNVADIPGNTILVSDAWGRERWGRYDQQGRLIEVIEPDPTGDGKLKTDGVSVGNLVTKYSYDTLGRLSKTEQGAQIREFKYDSLGRMIRQKLAEQTATLNESGQYVGVGHLTAKWGESFIYDNRSNLIQKTDARGVRANYSYQIAGADDPLNRLHAVWYDLSGPRDTSQTIHSAPGVSYQYMTAGDKTRLYQIRTEGFLTESFDYDGEGRVRHYTQVVDFRTNYPMVTSYLYDSLDRIKEMQYPAQYGITGDPRRLVQPTYDESSRLSNLNVNGQIQAGNIVYNAADQTTSIKIGPTGTNQITESYTFDPQTGLLTNQKAMKGTATLMNLTYSYAKNTSKGTLTGKTGQLTKITDGINAKRNREYIYDALGRLTQAKGLNGTTTLSTQTYTYDRYGNRSNVAVSGVAANNTTMPRDGVSLLTFDLTNNRIATAGYQYDVAGNQTRSLASDGVTWMRYEYDAANRIQLVKNDTTGVMLESFQYGSTNARLMSGESGQPTRIFATVDGTVLSEYTEFAQSVPTWTKSFTYLGDTLLSTVTPNGTSGEQSEFNHPDRLGTRLMTNQTSGTSTEQVTLPFGTALDAESTRTNNQRRFTSYERSKIGLDYAINRTYDSKLGRFTQVDPIGMSAVSLSAPQTLNLYSYCGNDPVNRTDPDGLFWGFFKKLFKWVMVAIAVAVVIVSIVTPGGQEFSVVGAKLLSSLLGLGAIARRFIDGDCGSGMPGEPPCEEPDLIRIITRAPRWRPLIFAAVVSPVLANLLRQNEIFRARYGSPKSPKRSSTDNCYDIKNAIKNMAQGVKQRIHEQLNGRIERWETHNNEIIIRQIQLQNELDKYDRNKCGGSGGDPQVDDARLTSLAIPPSTEDMLNQQIRKLDIRIPFGRRGRVPGMGRGTSPFRIPQPAY